MSIVHIVQQGDCLASISTKYGFADWTTIYNHDLNSELRSQRPDPHVLHPGDRVQIPELELKQESCQTEKTHRFRLKGRRARLRILIRDVDGRPVGAKKYILTLDGRVREGMLSDDGRLDERIPPDSMEGELRVWVDQDFPTSWKLRLGHIDPVETLTGVQARLNNLGYGCGPVDGVNGPRTQAALKAFQRDRALDEDGIPGRKTQEALKSEYGC